MLNSNFPKLLTIAFFCILATPAKSLAAPDTGPRNKFLEFVNHHLPTPAAKAIVFSGAVVLMVAGVTGAVVIYKRRNNNSKPNDNQNSAPEKDVDSHAEGTKLGGNDEDEKTAAAGDDAEDKAAAGEDDQDNPQDREKAPAEGATNNPSLPKQQNVPGEQKQKSQLPGSQPQGSIVDERAAKPQRQDSNVTETQSDDPDTDEDAAADLAQSPIKKQPRNLLHKGLDSLSKPLKGNNPKQQQSHVRSLSAATPTNANMQPKKSAKPATTSAIIAEHFAQGNATEALKAAKAAGRDQTWFAWHLNSPHDEEHQNPMGAPNFIKNQLDCILRNDFHQYIPVTSDSTKGYAIAHLLERLESYTTPPPAASGSEKYYAEQAAGSLKLLQEFKLPANLAPGLKQHIEESLQSATKHSTSKQAKQHFYRILADLQAE